jgi:hypothetical protein
VRGPGPREVAVAGRAVRDGPTRPEHVRGRPRAASERAASVRGLTGKQRAVLSALRDAQHAHDGEPVSAGQIAARCNGPWHRRNDLVTQALWLLHAQGLTLPGAGTADGCKITDRGRAELPPRRGPARSRPRIADAYRGPMRPRRARTSTWGLSRTPANGRMTRKPRRKPPECRIEGGARSGRYGNRRSPR